MSTGSFGRPLLENFAMLVSETTSMIRIVVVSRLMVFIKGYTLKPSIFDIYIGHILGQTEVSSTTSAHCLQWNSVFGKKS